MWKTHVENLFENTVMLTDETKSPVLPAHTTIFRVRTWAILFSPMLEKSAVS